LQIGQYRRKKKTIINREAKGNNWNKRKRLDTMYKAIVFTMLLMMVRGVMVLSHYGISPKLERTIPSNFLMINYFLFFAKIKITRKSLLF
jgi:hypothetical protein